MPPVRCGFLFLALFLVPVAAHAACTIPDGEAGEQIYNADYNVMQFCNGTDWISMSSVSAGVLTGTGSAS